MRQRDLEGEVVDRLQAERAKRRIDARGITLRVQQRHPVTVESSRRTRSVWSFARRGPCMIGVVGLQAVNAATASTTSAVVRSSREPGITVSIIPARTV